MKKIFVFISFALFTTLSCNKIEPVPEGPDCSVAFNLIGEISTFEEPITKAEGGSNDLYAIEVYQGSNVFAWGIFDHLDGIKVNLKKGSTYSVKIAKVNDAKTLLSSLYSLTNDGVQSVREDKDGPFKVYRDNSTGTNLNTGVFVKTNVFFYRFSNAFQGYSSSTSTSPSNYYTNNSSANDYYDHLVWISRGSLNNVNYPTCNDWFYGEASGFTPNGETMTWDIPLKRVGFKLKYEIAGVTDGSVTVTIKNGTRTFFQSTTTTPTYESATQFIAFYDAKSAWQYADNYMENLTVSVSWARGIGVTQDLGSKVVSIKRNCLNNIKITLGNDDRGASVSLNTEDDTTMGALDNTVTVQ